jgi:hypothetical protein
MKYVVAGLGLIAAAACFVACSGSSHQQGPPVANPSPEAGADLPDASLLGICKLATDCPNQVCDTLSGKCVDCRTASDCGLDKECTVGVCKDVTCVPNSTFCRNGSVSTCNGDGSTSTPTAHCTVDQFCLEKDDTAMCSATACSPGDPICTGNVATSCLTDGSGPKPGGTDCGKSKQSCYSGTCRDQICSPGKRMCDNGGLYFCSDAGTSRALLSSCGVGQVCDADAGACLPKVCDPGKLGCDSSRVVTCNGVGSGWNQSGPDCATTGSSCVAGACLPVTCVPGQSFCKDNKALRCSGDGTSSTLSQDCSQSQGNLHCESPNGYAFCTSPFCSPNAIGCYGDVLSTCNADGTDYLAGGTDCTLTNSACLNAKCVARVCTPSALFCASGNVQQCDDQGLTFTQSQYCASGTVCSSALAGPVECDPTPCSADTDGCVGEKFGHCAQDGLSVGGTVTDCGAMSTVCTAQGCAASAVATLSTANQVGTGGDGEALTNTVLVHTARKLTTIEAYLSFPTNRSVTWVVYEQTNANQVGEFDLAYQKTTPGSGTGFQSSGAISFELKAGKTYAIGFAVSGGSFVYYFDSTTAPQSLSFAHVVDSTDQSFGTPVPAVFNVFDQGSPSSIVYNARLTTTLP